LSGRWKPRLLDPIRRAGRRKPRRFKGRSSPRAKRFPPVGALPQERPAAATSRDRKARRAARIRPVYGSRGGFRESVHSTAQSPSARRGPEATGRRRSGYPSNTGRRIIAEIAPPVEISSTSSA
jgi:hypothetical protein